ncbi:S49 family peptidase [Salmonella enterica]|uniref:S49 family peptidase n=3 Tax=Salmonella enterica TaxID=28901 RepID=A0A9Y2Y933_SALEB|nr:S49 family peptidase [Salmonella enterica subsp. enterica serovar Java]EAN2415202.1 S49 family peptidase [Salmonella enterica]EBV8393211.1 S49 family peptidase [Salmonella enterica subsp. enterica serovar Virchow]EDQ0178784.1 S49 family peptidase [Salmonella enterica subsp. enterica serovar 4,[5],12:b:-]EDV9616154.1 S49 family peptidase [Salmonella enterica subsp. enterica serovar Paratyphi B]EEE5611146.1 S49 family peptidase [Salmonella enterica subsp. enterica serovar Typhimurium]EIK6738
MQRNLPHILSQATNAPLLLEPAYARVFFCALGRESGAASIQIPQYQENIDQDGMALVTGDFMSGGKPRARFYQVVEGIAVLPVSGTLVHKLGGMRPFSGMTGYDGITARLQQAISDPEVKGILLDIDSPGGQAAGAFDCADMIYRLGQQKPVWALMNDVACSGAMLLASACSRRLVTQTARIGSVGVVMAHASYAGQLEQEGVEITLLYSGKHKTDLNPYQALPDDVRTDYQQKMDATRQMFADRVAQYTGLSAEAVMATEAAIYDGQAGIEVGLSDEMINAADAVTVMAAALKSKSRGNNMAELTATEVAAQENQRVMGIIGCPEAKGREALAQMLAGQPGMSVAQAQAILAAAAPQQEAVSEADRIMALDDAQGREELASTLAAMPDMTVERAKTILAAAPRAGETSLNDSILSLDEAKGREELAGKLATIPGMTVEQARELLVAAPDASGSGGANMNNAFDQFMQLHSPASLSGNSGNSNDVDTDTQLLMSIPGTMATKGEDKS